MSTYFKLVLLVLFLAAGNSQAGWAQEVSSSQVSPRVDDWVRVGKSVYDWHWLAKHFDEDSDGEVEQSEFPASSEMFLRMDRTWDGRLSRDDFDWSKDGVLGKQKETTFALFKSMDSNSDGRITAEEWQALYTSRANDAGFLNEEMLEQLLFLPRVVKAARESTLRSSRSEYSPARLASRVVPQPGDLAPDFTLSSPDSSSTITLSDYRGKRPVVLVFGCYTCGNYRTYSESIEELYRFWKKDVEFLRVYVREAHPISDEVSATSTNSRAGILVKQPGSWEERCSVAEKFRSALDITTPLVVDGIDNSVGEAYGAWPDRLYVIDSNGRIVFTGGPGPFGFNPREMEQSLVMMLVDQGKATVSEAESK